VGTIEPDGIVPACHDRQAVDHLAVAAIELDIRRTVPTLLRRVVVERTGVQVVLLEITISIVKADGPDAIDGNLADVELVDSLSVIAGRREVEVNRIRGSTSPFISVRIGT
jgi:hypothetical protein